MITPLDYYRMYRQMTVDLVEGTHIFNVDVHEYRNAKGFWSPGGSSLSADFHVDDGMTQGWPKLQAKIKQHGSHQGGKRFSLYAGMTSPVPFAPEIEGAPACRVTEIVDLTELVPVFY